ncbi:MAG: hypothetical protein IIB38_09600 [Candidatus Hydrogenedentes bacterium]|nr:hypothetical protein [Candidatus Hydrogenedentota bacterium]
MKLSRVWSMIEAGTRRLPSGARRCIKEMCWGRRSGVMPENYPEEPWVALKALVQVVC